MSYMLKTSESKPLVQITLPHHSFEHQHFSPLIFLSLSMNLCLKFLIFSLVQSLSHVQLFVSPWIAACQASLSITNSQSLLKLMYIKSVMPSNHLVLCHPLLLPPSIFPSIRVFCNESVLCIRWPKYWSFSFSISPSNEYSGLISFRMDWLDLPAVQGTLKSQEEPGGRQIPLPISTCSQQGRKGHFFPQGFGS